jgi:S1-C subfamily serine protease
LAAFGIGVVVFATWWQKNYSGPTILDQNTSSAPGGRADGAPQNSHLKVPDGPSSLAAQPRRLTVGEIITKVGPGVVLLSCLDSKGKEYGLGSGFVIDSSGLVATSFHVVRRAWKVNATFSDGAAG